MAILLIVVLVTIALATRAGVLGRRWSAADSETADDTGLLDNCARSFTLVLMSLVGLFALGITYGNVLSTGPR
jgi:hypothetical protein